MTTTTARLTTFLQPLTEEASEVILRVDEPPRARVGGELEEIDSSELTREAWRELLAVEIPTEDLDAFAVDDRFRRQIEVEGIGLVDVRVYLYDRRPAATVRLLEAEEDAE